MAILDSAKVDLLYKKLFGAAKSDLPGNKGPANEATASPFINRGDKIYVQAAAIPAVAAAVSGIVGSYNSTSRIQCTADATTTPVGGVYPTWKTGLSDWIPPEFGSTYFVKAYVGVSGLSDPATTGGTQIFDSGSGGTGEWWFDYQAGVLNFIGGTIPATLTASNVVYIYGYRYIGAMGANSSIAPGTDISLSTTSGVVTISDISTLQSVTGRGNSTTNAIIISSTASSTSTNTGALTVVGGVGIGNGLYVGGPSTFTNTSTFLGPISFSTTSSLTALGYVSVKQYGAVGDGVTDDSTAINNALASSNYSIYFPAGTYIINSRLTAYTSNKYIWSNGDATIKIASGVATGFSAIAVRGSNVILKNLTIDGNLSAVPVSGDNSGISLEPNAGTLDRVSIDSCTLQNFIGYGIYSFSSGTLTNLKITNSRFINFTSAVAVPPGSIQLVTPDLSNITVTGCKFTNTTGCGIALRSQNGTTVSTNIIISNNIIENQNYLYTSIGCEIWYGKNVAIVDNVFRQGRMGVSLYNDPSTPGNTISITGNTFDTHSYYAIEAGNTNGLTISGNSFDNFGYGVIFYNGAKDVVVVGNAFKNAYAGSVSGSNLGWAVQLNGNAAGLGYERFVISDNTFFNCSGVRSDYLTTGEITNNIFETTSTNNICAIILNSSTQYQTISNNVFKTSVNGSTWTGLITYDGNNHVIANNTLISTTGAANIGPAIISNLTAFSDNIVIRNNTAKNFSIGVGAGNAGQGTLSNIVLDNNIAVNCTTESSMLVTAGRIQNPTSGGYLAIGNQDYTAAGRTEHTLHFTVAFTTNRTLTLDTATAYKGQMFRVAKIATDAYSLSVNGLRSLVTGQWCDVTYNGSAWVVSGFGYISTSIPMTIASTAVSTSTTTGALVVAGGVGIGGDLFVGATGYVQGAVIVTTATFSETLGTALATVSFTATYITQNPNIVPVPAVGTTTTYGTYNFGSLTDITSYGDYNTVAQTGYYSVNDATGAPAHVEYIGFSNVTEFNRAVFNINYTTASGHTVDIDLYNYQTNGWDTFAVYSGSGNWQQFALGLIDHIPYISAANSVTTRIYHLSSGNTAHRTWIDYVALEQSTTGGQGPRGATGATGATGAQGVNTGTTTTFIISNTAETNSTITGALQVVGGVGIGGGLFVGGVVTATNITSSTSTNTGALQIAGGVGIGGNLNVGGNTILTGNLTVNSNFSVGNTVYTSYTSPVISSPTAVYLDTFSATQFRTAKYLIQITDTGYTPNRIQVAEILVFHDNNGASTIVDITNYGISSNTGELGSFDAVYLGGLIEIYFTPTYTPTTMTVRLSRTAMNI